MDPLHEHVLVLNRLWQAVNICPMDRAIALLYIGHAQVVHQDEDGGFETHGFRDWCFFHPPGPGDHFLQSKDFRVKLPRIILLQAYDRFPRKDVKFTRINVFERDQHTCQYCGIRPERALLNIDHVMPRALGGKTTWTNVVCSCIRCNARKADRTPEQAGMRLMRNPVKPAWRPFMEMRCRRRAHASWGAFLLTAT